MTPKPYVSVIVPAYEAATTIEDALESALAQSLSDLECIVVDDGSSDATSAVVRSVAGRDPRVRFFRQANGGPAAARNLALRHAQGAWVAFLDADDYWLPGKLECQLAAAAGADVVYSDAYLAVNDVRVGTYSSRWPPARQGEAMFEYLLTHPNPVALLTVLVRRQALIDVGGFSIEWRCAEDLDLWLRLAQTGRRFQYVDVPTCEYRLRPRSLSANRPRHLSEEWRLFSHWADRLHGSSLQEAGRARANSVGLAALRARRSVDAPWHNRAADLRAMLSVTRRFRPLVIQATYVLAPRLLARVVPAAMDRTGLERLS